VGDVGRGAAHVEGDDPAEAAHGRGPDRADDAAGRPREDRVLALEQARVGEAAVGLHEHEPGVAQLAGHLVHVAAQDRREIGVDHRGVASGDQLHERAHLMADRDLGEADVPGQGRHPALVLWIAVAVHEDDRRRADAPVVGRL
jgi:hypothetical protein